MRVALTVAFAVIAFAGMARADEAGDEAKKKARELFKAAVVARAEKKFAACHEKAVAAYELHAHSQIAGVRAHCAFELGKFAEAANMATAWLADEKIEAAPKDREEMRGVLAQAKKKVGLLKVKVLGVERAEVRVDDVKVGVGDVVLFVEVGGHEIRVSGGGMEKVIHRATDEGSEVSVEVRLGAPPSPPPPGPRASGPNAGMLGAGVAIGVLGLGAVGAGVGLFVVSGDRLMEADALRTMLGPSPSACFGAGVPTECGLLKRAVDDQAGFRNASVPLFIAGAAFAVAGGTLVALSRRPTHVRLDVGYGSIQLGASLR